MNGIHDMGGMAGLGHFDPRSDEPLFHEPWEARVLALTLAAGALGRWTIDKSRFYRESIPGPEYLAISYYERWFTALSALLVDAGLITAAEAQCGRAEIGATKMSPPLTANAVREVLARGGPTHRPPSAPDRFVPGEAVRARNLNPEGHIRLPRYVRGRQGTITRLHGAHVFPDTNAHDEGEHPQSLYQVRFEASELWGPDTDGRGAVYLDLWETYLEPA
jgi:nitrile hydratase